MNARRAQLLFVYNANSGVIFNYIDSLHKIISPQTYTCDLCALTHGLFKEKKVWKHFRERATIPMRFLHKDVFLKEYRSKWLPRYDFPVVLWGDGEALSICITAAECKEVKTIEEFIALLNERINALNLS